MKRITILFLTTLICITLQAQKIDSCTVYGKVTESGIYYRVISPDYSSKYYFYRTTDAKMSLSHIRKKYAVYEDYYNNAGGSPILFQGKPVSDEEIKKELNQQDETTSAATANNEEETNLPLDNRTIIAKLAYDDGVSTSSTDIEEGERYEILKVSTAQDVNLIGCPITCQVITKRKSNVSGSEGRLVIRPLYITTKDGQRRYLLPSDISKRGLNRSNVKLWTCWTVIMMFVPGTRAEISPDETFELRLE